MATPFDGIFSAFAAVFNWITGRNATNNRPDIVTNREAIEDAKARDQNNADIAEALRTGNVDKLRKKETGK